MVGYGLVTAVLIFVLARRLGLRHGYAVLAMGLWGLSPLVGLEMRQVFLDNIALPWLIAAFVFVTIAAAGPVALLRGGPVLRRRRC